MKNSILKLDAKEINSVSGGKQLPSGLETAVGFLAAAAFIVLHYYFIGPYINMGLDYLRNKFSSSSLQANTGPRS